MDMPEEVFIRNDSDDEDDIDLEFTSDSDSRHQRYVRSDIVAERIRAERERADELAAHVVRLRGKLPRYSALLKSAAMRLPDNDEGDFHLKRYEAESAEVEQLCAASPETSLIQRDEQIRDHATRCQTVVCCAMLARQNDLTMVEEILIAAGMTEPEDFIGCTQEDIDEIAAIAPRRVKVRADEIAAGGGHG